MKSTQTRKAKPNTQMLNVAGSLQKDKIFAPAAAPANKTQAFPLFTYRWWKDISDRVLALIAAVIVSPLLALIAIIIRLDSPGNAIFSQERVGKGGRKFVLYKFRSMYLDHDDSEYYKKIERYVRENVISPPTRNAQDNDASVCDPRITKIGRLLRKTNLDELPQLFNILKGEMSFVGPRPMIPFIVEMYNDHHKKSFGTKPGITGLWQASGRKKLSFEDMIQLDIDYISKQSLLLDTKIILLTVRTVLKGEGS
jgi:lipopolysaccharide/colanic/teichoic acid biosynthesis glycosyltransferase